MTFSVLAEQWHQKANFGGIGRHRATGISIGNKGYIGLGHVNGSGIDISYNDWWQFDPASNSWTQKANYPTVNHGAVGFGTSTKGYVGGGSYLGGEFYCYDPEMNTWTPIATCPTTPGDVQCFSIQNKGYIIYSTELYEYDPLTNTWSSKADCPVSVTTWASSFSTESSGFVKTLSSLYEYKPASDTWLQRTPFPGLMSGGAAAFESDNKGYFICGFSGALSTVTNEIWEFNPGNNQWMRIGFFPGTSRRFPVAFSINNKGYFGTGTNGINMNDFWEYNPEFAELSELNDYKVTVYPNPSIDVVNFVSQNENSTYIDESKVELFSIDGKLLIQENFSSHGIAIKIDHLQKGNYLYRILNKGQIIQTGNIIKN
jgi:N-acetylneuraminic acid mutarotase